MNSLFWYDHIFVIAMLLLIAGAVRQQKGITGTRFSSRDKLTVYIANSLALWAMALLALGIWWWGDRPLARIGLCQPNPATTKWSALIAGLIVATWAFDFFWQTRPRRLANTRREWLKNTPFMPDSIKESVWFVPLALSAGICEEVVFRGYLIRYFESLLGDQSWSAWLAMLIPAAVFAWGHRYQRRIAMIKIFLLALAFGTLFIVSGSLLWCALIHFGIDFAAGLTSPYLMTGPVSETPDGGDETIAAADPELPTRTPDGGPATAEGNLDRGSSPSDPATSDHRP